jgi:hypothetical protein
MSSPRAINFPTGREKTGAETPFFALPERKRAESLSSEAANLNLGERASLLLIL